MSEADVFLVLQSYIDFEISEGNRENTRKLYERLLQRTRHVKVGMRAAFFHSVHGLPAADPRLLHGNSQHDFGPYICRHHNISDHSLLV